MHRFAFVTRPPKCFLEPVCHHLLSLTIWVFCSLFVLPAIGVLVTHNSQCLCLFLSHHPGIWLQAVGHGVSIWEETLMNGSENGGRQNYS